MAKRKDKFWFALFTVPLLFIFTTVVIIPFIMGIYYSFFQWNGMPANPKIFNGLKNYAELFQDHRFLISSLHTVEFTAMAVTLVNLLGFIFALLVSSKLRGTKTSRTLFFMPNLIGGLILGYIWQFIFTKGFEILGKTTGLHDLFFAWLLHPNDALFATVIVFTWQMAGYTMVIYLAGIQGIPSEMIEAAKVDGANSWQRLRKVVFPLLMPSFTICLFLTLAEAFKIYDVNLSLTGGGPGHSTELLAMNIYNEIFSYGHYGYGQAKAVAFFIVVATITLTQVYITKKREVQL
ncbi:MAG TPA: sugar ABC transporter permease [Bacillales bacterium]|nr:sugar ABC transporter permease [Bacillales bacterium]